MDRRGFSDNIDSRELGNKEGKLKSPKLEPSRSGVPFRESEEKEADLPGKKVPSFDGEGSSPIDKEKRLKELRRSHGFRDHLSNPGSFQPALSKSNRISDGSLSEPSRPQEREEIHETSPSQGPAGSEQSKADEDKQKKSYSLLEKDVPGKKRKNQPLDRYSQHTDTGDVFKKRKNTLRAGGKRRKGSSKRQESKIQPGNVECAREQSSHVNVMRNLPEAREVSQNGEVKKETRGEAEMLIRESELGQTCSWFSQVSDRVRQVCGWALQESSKVWQRLPSREAVVRNVGAVMVLGLLTSSLLVPRQTDSFVPELSWERSRLPRKYLIGDKKYSVAVPHRRAVGTSRDVPALQEGFSVDPSSFRGKADEAPESLSEQTNSDDALALSKRKESFSGPADQPDTRGNEGFFEAAALSRYRALYHVQLHMIRKLEIEKIDLDAANKMLQNQIEALDRANKRLQDQTQTQEETILELQKLTQTFIAIRQSLDPSEQRNSQEDTGINLSDGCCRGKADEAPESLSEQTNSSNVPALPKGMESQKNPPLDVTLSKTIPSEEISQSPMDSVLAYQLEQDKGKGVDDLMESYCASLSESHGEEFQGKELYCASLSESHGEEFQAKKGAFQSLADELSRQLEQDSSKDVDDMINSYFASLLGKYEDKLLGKLVSSQKSGDNPSVSSEQKHSDNKKRKRSANADNEGTNLSVDTANKKRKRSVDAPIDTGRWSNGNWVPE